MMNVRCSHIAPDYAQVDLPGVADNIAFLERRNIRTSLNLNSGEEHRADRWFVYWLGAPTLDDAPFRDYSHHERTGFPTMRDAACWIGHQLSHTMDATAA